MSRRRIDLRLKQQIKNQIEDKKNGEKSEERPGKEELVEQIVEKLEAVEVVDSEAEGEEKEENDDEVVEAARCQRAFSPNTFTDEAPPSPIPLRRGPFTESEVSRMLNWVCQRLKDGERIEKMGLKGKGGWQRFDGRGRGQESLRTKWRFIVKEIDTIERYGLAKEDSEVLKKAVNKMKTDN